MAMFCRRASTVRSGVKRVQEYKSGRVQGEEAAGENYWGRVDFDAEITPTWSGQAPTRRFARLRSDEALPQPTRKR